MKMIDWGSGWKLSQLCFGVLPMGPLQKDMTPEQGGELLLESFRAGVNFIDTAQSYQTYPHIRHALDRWHSGRVFVATKSGASSYEEMDEAVREALAELNRDYIEIFHLHAARVSPGVFQQRRGALECLMEYRDRGQIGRIGIATHSVTTIEQAALEDCIDVVFALINVSGLGILDGDRKAMEEAIGKVSDAGKMLYAMKVFGGGNLIERRREALDYALSVHGIDNVAIGMVSGDELAVNLSLLDGEPDEEMMRRTGGKSKELMIASFCAGCGKCLELCPNAALYLEEGKGQVDRDKCILCGYCAPECPEFAIRVI